MTTGWAHGFFIVFSDLSGVGCVVIGEPECPLIISSAVCEEECFKHSNARCITQMLLLSQIPKSLMPSRQQLRLSWSSSPRVDHINKHELGSRSNDWVGYESVSRSLKDEESKITPIDDSKTATILLQDSRRDTTDQSCQEDYREKRRYLWLVVLLIADASIIFWWWRI